MLFFQIKSTAKVANYPLRNEKHMQPVTEQALLLCISPALVTKVRQRLKGRLGSENVHHVPFIV